MAAPPEGRSAEEAYPAHWEADVIARDGEALFIRPIRPEDRSSLQRLHLSQSETSRIFRFFAPRSDLSEAELDRFTQVDHHERVALVVTDDSADNELLALGCYDGVDDTTAEVSFYVADSAHGRGLGSILLDHLAAAAWERGFTRFEADLLPTNARMLAVFRDAGYALDAHLDEGILGVSFEIAPTDESWRVLGAREQHSEALSMGGVLNPDHVVAVGQGPALPPGLTAWDGGTLPPGTLALLDVPATQLGAQLEELGAAGAHGAVYYGDASARPARWYQDVLRTARMSDVRLVGPGSFGVLVADGTNLTRDPRLSGGGTLGVIAHGARSAAEIAERLAAAGHPVRTFLSAGQRLDVSGNDAMQWWLGDPGTRVAAISLDSIGNPRKFARVSRALARRIPVVCYIERSTGQFAPPGHPVRTSPLPRELLSGMLRQSGVIEAGTRSELVDLARLAEGGRSRSVRLVATTDSAAEAARRLLTLAGVPLARAEDASEGEVLLVVDQPLPGEERSATAEELTATAAGAVMAVLRHPAPLRLGDTGAVTTDELGRAVRLLALLTMAPPSDSPLATVEADHAGARRALAGAAGQLDEATVAALLAAYGLAVDGLDDGHEETGTGQPREIDVVLSGQEDPLHGPVISFHHAGDSELLGDIAYRIAPLSERDVRELVMEPRASVLLKPFVRTGVERVVTCLARLKDDLPDVARIALEVRVGNGTARVTRARVEYAPSDRVDARPRAMAEPAFE